MTLEQQPFASAADLRLTNAALDAELLRVVKDVPEGHFHDEFSDEAWTLAVQVGHLAEFPTTFGRQLRSWLGRERVVVGRIAECDPEREDALLRATVRRLPELVEELEASLALLSSVLAMLRDEHLTATVYDVAAGRQTLTVFLDRYLLSHKAEHTTQLGTTLRNLRTRSAG